MARQILAPGTGAGVNGGWVDCMPPGSRNFPARVTVVGSSWSAGTVTLQHYVDGQSASPVDLAVVDSPGPTDVLIKEPIEFIRAVTSGDLAGTVGVWMVPSL